MSKAAVFLAWGNPDRIRSGVRTGIHSKPGFTQPPAPRFYRIIITTPVFTDLDIFAAEFGGIITISILLVATRIPSTRIRTQLLMRFLTRLRISKEIVALDGSTSGNSH